VAVAALVGGGALVLTAADLVSLDKRFLTPVPERSYRSALAATPAMHFLRDEYRRAEEPFRVYPLGRDFQSNDWMYHRIPSIGGYAAVKLRVYQDLLDYALQKGQGMPNLKLAGAMNARYLVTAQQLPEGFQVVYRDDASQRIVYENPFYLPRAWFVDVVRVMEDEVALMERLSDPGWNPAQEALVTEAPKMKIGQPDTLSWARVPADRYGPHAFEIECSTPDDGFLVVSEIWYPQGWVATLDGEPVPIWRTNYGFRGIAVPPGEHTVRMEFHPPEVRAGFLISILSSVFVLLLVAGGAWLVVHRRAQALEARIEE
jgi:hypothetical protein